MKTALRITREQNFADWYQEVIKRGRHGGKLAGAGLHGHQALGLGIWEHIQSRLDPHQGTGHEIVIFPSSFP